LAQAKLGSTPRLINGYGPTEATTFTTCYQIPTDIGSEAESIPIGRPLANTQVYVLDSRRNLVPIGIPGELYIGGAGLARGYLNRHDLTNEKFVAHPFSDHPDARLYRSGDRCRWRADGTLEFQGRTDDQFKLRGFRIEPAEIESVLNQHPEVVQSVVVLHENQVGNEQIIAYCVAAEGRDLDSAKLSCYLGTRLPKYMVPSIVELDEIPLTLNGKVDRRALPAPKSSLDFQVNGYQPPQSSVEKQLASIWERVLGVERVGIQSDFFQLGGHSMLAVRLFSEIESTFDRYLPLATLFQAPTVRQLARVIENDDVAQGWQSLVPIRPSGTRPPLYCLHGVGGNVVGFDALAQYLSDDQPLYGLQARGLDGQTPPLTSVESMSQHYLKEIRQLQPQGPYYLAGYSFGGLVAFEIAREMVQQGDQVALVALLDSQARFNAVRHIDQLRRSFLFQLRRMRYHVAKVVMLSPSRKMHYFLAKLHTLRRRRGNRRWQAAVRKWRETATDENALPSQLENVEEACFMAAKTYQPNSYPGRVVLFVSEGQRISRYDPAEVWATLAEGGLEIQSIPGDHLAMLSEPNVRIVAAQLERYLGRAD
jgi:aspartate racemase